MAKKKFYAVIKGKEPGIYSTWAECKEQVDGYSGAVYKGFPTEEEAKMYLTVTSNVDTKIVLQMDNEEINYNSIAVDGACAGNPGIGEYQCVDVATNEIIFHHSGFEDTTNNIMEFLALVDAIKYIKENNLNKAIYSDSVTAMAWVRNKKANSNLRPTKRNFDSKKMMDLAEEWLKNNNFSDVEILKWDTNKWGEIPADFGRK